MAGIIQLRDIYSDDAAVKFTDLDNFFNIYQNEDSYYYFNLNSTVYIDVPQERLQTYVCQHDLHWSIISFNIYGTVRLAWLLMKLNGITSDLAFQIIPAGSKVKYLDKSDVATVISRFSEKQ